MANFSNYGATTVHIGAPGVKILSTVPGNKYDSFNGTSMASPHVAGAAALLKAMYPKASWKRIKARLLYNADITTALSGKTWSNGRLNLERASELDRVPPSVVSEMSQVGSDLVSVTLQMNASLDDDAEDANPMALASAYEFRMSATPILTEEDWNAAKVPAYTLESVAGSQMQQMKVEIKNLSLNSKMFVAARAVDNVGNMSPLNQSLEVQTRFVSVLSENTASSMSSVSAPGNWGIETVDERTCFSDSVGKDYEDRSVNELVTESLNVSLNGKPAEMLRVEMKYDLESTYDYGFVYMSQDGGKTFQQLGSYTGMSDWTPHTYDLRGKLKPGVENIQLKFAVKSDSTESKEGMFVDSIQVLKAVD
jgi:hypothetical protein